MTDELADVLDRLPPQSLSFEQLLRVARRWRAGRKSHIRALDRRLCEQVQDQEQLRSLVRIFPPLYCDWLSSVSQLRPSRSRLTESDLSALRAEMELFIESVRAAVQLDLLSKAEAIYDLGSAQQRASIAAPPGPKELRRRAQDILPRQKDLRPATDAASPTCPHLPADSKSFRCAFCVTGKPLTGIAFAMMNQKIALWGPERAYEMAFEEHVLRSRDALLTPSERGLVGSAD